MARLTRFISVSFAALFIAPACGTATSDPVGVETDALRLGHGEEAGAGNDGTTLPVAAIERILGTDGHVSNGVLDLSIGRDDLGHVSGPQNVTFDGSFEIHGDVYFQPLDHGRALLNGDMALLAEETNPFIAALLANHLTFQAFHQHLVELDPPVWFVHYRGTADPLTLARELRTAIDVTKAPLPQSSPSNPTTPLDADALATILHGDAQVGAEGVVTVSVARRHGVRLGNSSAEPETGISTSIEFEPLDAPNAVAVPDFSLTSAESDRVIGHMLNDLGWFQGCLYNQETAEQPQLYFDHMLKTGNAYELAREIRSGLDLTDSE